MFQAIRGLKVLLCYQSSKIQ